MRRAKPDECRHQIDVLFGIGFRRHRAACRRIVDDAEAVAQPLHRRAGHEDRSLQRVGRLAVEPVGDRRQHPVLRRHLVRAGVQQRETAGSIGRFEHARFETRLPNRRRLLVTRHPEDRDFGAEYGLDRGAEIGSAIENIREDGSRNAEDFQQFPIPLVRRDVVDQRPRGIGRVGDVAHAAGQPPDQEGVDRAEGDLAGFRLRPQSLDVVQQPGDLGAREIGIEQQAGLFGEQRLAAIRLETVAQIGGAPVLPDDRPVHRFARLAVPHRHRLALVGDADRRDVSRRDTGLAHCLAAGVDHAGPDILEIVFDPAGTRKVLRKLFLADTGDFLPAVENDRPRRGRPLVYRQYITAHPASSLQFFPEGIKTRSRRWLQAASDFSPFARSSQRQVAQASAAPTNCMATNSGTSAGRMPAKVSEKPRAIVTAGLAKDVEAVNQ